MKRNFYKILYSTMVLSAAGVMAAGTANASNWQKIQNSIQNNQPILVQSSDSQALVEMDQLREQVRDLNGRVEELTFQLLQMQEQIRKMQDDNEFRFQELEEKQSSLKGDADKELAQKDDGDNLPGKPQPSERKTERSDGENSNQSDPGNTRGSTGTLGSLDRLGFDADGNFIKGSLNKPPKHQERGDLGDYSERLNEVLQKNEPTQLYKFGRDQIYFGDYVLASETFNAFLALYQGHAHWQDALFWLGKAYLLQEEFEKAAQNFIRHHREFPQSPYGAETLLYLGIALAGLNQREAACATFAEIPTQYPADLPPILRKLNHEKKTASCS